MERKASRGPFTIIALTIVFELKKIIGEDSSPGEDKGYECGET